MSKTIAQKLLLKEGYTLVLVNAPDGYAERIMTLVEDITISEDAENVDMVHVFANTIAELETYAVSAMKRVKDDGLIWISYPKMSSGIKTDINRDTGWESVFSANYRPVTQISIDDTWSALRFRKSDKVGK